MTPALERALRRREALMKPRGDRGGGLAGLASLFGGGAPVGDFGAGNLGDVGPSIDMVAPAQGPGLPGATTGGITAPGKTHFFIRGRGPTIDFGPIFRPKSTGVDPMQGDPFQATKGVGGFFRRLLGDNSNELNEQYQNMRMQRGFALADRAADQAFRSNLLDRQLASQEGIAADANVARGEEAELERKRAAADAEMQRNLARWQTATQAQNAMDIEGSRQVNQLIRDAEMQRHQRGMAQDEFGFRRELSEAENNLWRLGPDGTALQPRTGTLFTRGVDDEGNPVSNLIDLNAIRFGGSSGAQPAAEDPMAKAAAIREAFLKARAGQTQGALSDRLQSLPRVPGGVPTTVVPEGESFQESLLKEREAKKRKELEELRQRVMAPNYGSLPLGFKSANAK